MPEVNYNNDPKNECRYIATQYDGMTYKTALFFPETRAACVKQAYEEGTIDNNSNLILVEKDREKLPQIKESIEELGLLDNCYFINRDLLKVDLSLLPTVDYAFLDFCGCCNHNVVKWLLDTSYGWLSPSARLSFTFCCCWRNEALTEWMKTVIKSYDSCIPVGTAKRLHSHEDQNWLNFAEIPGAKSLSRKAYVEQQHLMVDNSLPYEYIVNSSRYYKGSSLPMVLYHGYLNALDNLDSPGKLNEALTKFKVKESDRTYYQVKETKDGH